MIILGNLLLVVAAFLVATVGRLQLAGMPSGDRGVGYAFMLLLSNGALVLLMLAVTAILNTTHRLPAFAFAGSRPTAVAFAFVAFAAIAAAAMTAASPGGALKSGSVGAVMRLAPVIAQSLLIIAAAVLLNRQSTDHSVPTIVTASLAVVAVASTIFAAVGVAPFVMNRAQGAAAIASRSSGSLDSFQQGTLDEINAADSISGFLTFVSYTSESQPSPIRDRAVARLRAVPDWETRLQEALATPSARDVMTFLNSNDVPHPDSFAAPLTDGIKQVATGVRERIRGASHPSHLYDGLGVFEVEDVLRATRKFGSYGVDYTPAMRELRAAFEERTPYPRPSFSGAKALDRWLAKKGP